MVPVRRLAILGSTGSIGVNSLRVVSALKDKFEITALSADSNVELIAEQARAFSPKVISVRDEPLARKLKSLVSPRITVLSGVSAIEEIVSRPDVDIVIFAMSTSSCLNGLVRAIRNGKRIALANKEALVSAGSVVMPLARANNVSIIPIDSEHSAIFQCIEGKREFLKKLYLTATGGPLLSIPKNRFDSLGPKRVLKHPKWKMGKKISVDSATMMNKGLEIIEARWLFDIGEDKIDVIVHPEAIIHSMAEFIDGAILAQLSVPDMRIPIQYAITYPQRFKSTAQSVDFSRIRELSFEKPDLKKFPCLGLAREALKRAGTHPAVLNGADEEVVKSYLSGGIKFSRIPVIIEKVMNKHRSTKKEPSIDDILDVEDWAREETRKLCYH